MYCPRTHVLPTYSRTAHSHTFHILTYCPVLTYCPRTHVLPHTAHVLTFSHVLTYCPRTHVLPRTAHLLTYFPRPHVLLTLAQVFARLTSGGARAHDETGFDALRDLTEILKLKDPSMLSLELAVSR